jgi:hypothetical protein
MALLGWCDSRRAMSTASRLSGRKDLGTFGAATEQARRRTLAGVRFARHGKLRAALAQLAATAFACFCCSVEMTFA